MISIATEFAASSEFAIRYGPDPSDAELIDGLYSNVLGRKGEPGGVAFWLDQRANGMTVPELLIAFADSKENRDRTGTIP